MSFGSFTASLTKNSVWERKTVPPDKRVVISRFLINYRRVCSAEKSSTSYLNPNSEMYIRVLLQIRLQVRTYLLLQQQSS